MQVKKIGKRAASLLLVAVMLVSSWVFTQPDAYANQTDYKYSVKVFVDFTKSEGLSNKSYVDLSWEGGSERLFSATNNKSYGDQTYTRELSGFPTGISANKVMYGWFGNGAWTITLYVYNYNTGAYDSLCSFSQNVTGNGNHYGSASVPNDKKPYAASIAGISGDDSITLAPAGGTVSSTSAYAPGPVRDQYGYNINGAAATLSSNNAGGTWFSGNVLYANENCNSADNYNVVLTATYGSVTCTKNVAVNVFDYLVTFADWNGTELKAAQTVDYNGTATPPANPSRAYDATNHYTFNGWDTSYTNITTGVQSKTITATYTTTAHGSWVYSDNGSDANHNKKCGGCDYTTTPGHDYTTTTFTFADDGKSATASRTCQTAGCRHEQTQTITLGNGITSAVTTNETCTTVGTTTYTATSPFGDGATATKAVNDRPALNHSWGGWGPHSATEHIRTCSRCGATDTAAHTYPADPSYTSNGDGKNNTHYYTCTTTGCGYQNTAQHTWDDGTVTTSATCTTAGVKTYHCTAKGCTGTYTEEIPATDHNTTGQPWVNTDPDTHWKECLNGCGIRQEEAAHDMGDWVKIDGNRHAQSCKVCGYTITDDHSYTSEVTAPTCTAQGYTTYSCKDCPYSYETDYTSPTGHDEAKLDTTAISYESDGTNHWKTCDWCNQAVYNNNGTWTLGTDGHNPVESVRDDTTLVTPATCTQAGYYHHVCSDCARVLATQYQVSDGGIGKATGHTYTAVSIAPTDNTSGKVVCNCNSCGKYWKAQYNQEEHKYEPQPEANAETNLEEAAKASAPVPAPFFNNYAADLNQDGEQDYNYSERLSSLRLMKDAYVDKNTTVQDIRFSGSLSVPYIESGGSKAYVSYAVDPVSVRIGYIRERNPSVQIRRRYAVFSRF